MNRDIPPIPELPGNDGARGAHTRKRERLLNGDWRELLDAEMQRRLGSTRFKGLAATDMSSNVMLAVSKQLAVLYDRMPMVGLK